MSYAAFVNAHNRSANGFFLTSKKPEKGEVCPENSVYEEVVALVAQELKDTKIKSVNVLTSLVELEALAEKLLPKVIESSEKHNLDNKGSSAYLWLVIVACISSYHENIRKLKLKNKTE